ncbi:hypothetical protein [Streptomyces sp. ISL-86]|uniref:hypothetical protein n=1 Tax=Streptomyces sp. ISL-86 TaxID=2819187 RepID=UPI001BE54A9B|nr:hypothetical protein [Streptomyces sp. ISL-86]MBT2453280.1 hypothetical protein [Streptomyces sp. ISL-86]
MRNTNPFVIPAREIREGDVLRGIYAPTVTLDTAARPGEYAPDWSDMDRRPMRLPIPHRAKVAGPRALELRSGRRLDDDNPVLVTREPIEYSRRGYMTTPQEREDFAEAVGKIAAFAAMSLHESFPHVSVESLVETFTQPSAFNMLGTRFLTGLERGLTPGEAAGEAGAALIRLWADARLEARAQLDRENATV